MSLKKEMDQYLSRLDRETQKTLPRIERAMEQSGLVFDHEISDRLKRFAINRITETYDNFEIGNMFSTESSRDNGLRKSKKRDYGSESDYGRQIMRKIGPKIPPHQRNCPTHKRNGAKPSFDRRRSSKGSSLGASRRIKISHSHRNRIVCKNRRIFAKRKIDFKKSDAKYMSFQSTPIQEDDERSFETNLDYSEPIQHSMAKSATLPYAFSFACYHCFTEQQPLLEQTSSENDINCRYFNCIEEVYDHWIKTHTRPDGKPFQFYLVEKSVTCFYCDATGSYGEVFNHQNQVHTKEPRVVVAGAKRKCALCSYEGEEIMKHFSSDHTGFPPKLNETLTNDILAWLLEIDMTGHDLDGQANGGTQANGLSYDSVDYLICGCQSTLLQQNYFSHFENHSLDFVCNTCKSTWPNTHQKFFSLAEVVSHDKYVHQMGHSLIPRFWQLEDQLQKNHLNTKVVYKNGLVVAMRHLLNTKFDISLKFNECVQTILDAKKVELMQTEENFEKMKTNTSASSSVGSSSPNDQIELQKQNELINDVFIYGIPYKYNENLVPLISKLCHILGANIKMKDVLYVLRPSRRKPIITLRCSNYETKTELLKYNKSMVRSKDLFLAPSDYNKSTFMITIRSLTTEYVTKLMRFAKRFVENKELHNFWWTEQGLFVKRSNDCDGKHILNRKELLDYLE